MLGGGTARAATGLRVAFHCVVQITRQRMGHGSEVDGRRIPWVIGGLALKDYGLNLAAGLFLMLALRAALTHSLAHSNWMWIAANLSAAGLAHAADILLRFNRRNRRNH